MLRSFVMFFLLAGCVSSTTEKVNPPTANAILKEALVKAKQENKDVLIIFHASWCGWCHRMDSSINDPACKKYFDDHFVIRYLVVYESKGKENLENPGALELLTRYKGNDEGIPFWLFFDKNGKLLADSKLTAGEGGAKQSNMGCPATESEVTVFVNILRKITIISDAEAAAVFNRFRKNDRP